MRLGDFIEEHGAEILEAWAKDARQQAPSARGLDRPALIDQVPRLLADFARVISTNGERPSLERIAEDHADEHAAERIDQGFMLSHVVRELALLRSTILRLWREAHPALSVDEAELLTRVVDAAIERSVDRYFERRARLLEGFEEIAREAFQVESVDAFLERMLQLFMRHAPSIDSAAILLREEDRLTIRASVGFEEDVRQGTTMRIGEGFSGTIAATGKPLLLHEAWRDPLMTSPFSRARKTRALYGVPLFDAENLVGVAHIGSVSSDEIPAHEMRLFAALARRATSAIVKHRLREQVAADVQRTAEFRERFIAIVSHDLRNPMNAIAMAATTMFKSPDLPPSLAKPAGRILANVDRMARMVSDLLDFTRGRLGGGMPTRPQPVDLRAVVARACAELEDAHPQAAIQVEIRGDTDGTWDRERLAQVVVNLASNAIQHGARGLPILVLLDGTAAGRVRLEVHNEGGPIPADLLPHIFDPFRRGRGASPDGSPGGLGLGLFIACEVVRAHGGRIHVASSAAEGTTFHVELPRHCAVAALDE